MEEMKNKVNKHDIEITYIKRSLEELVKSSEQANLQLQKIAESISKQEVILTKISNLEDNLNGSIKRTHKRIDSLELTIREIKQDLKDTKHELNEEIINKENNFNSMIKEPCQANKIIQNELKHINEKVANHQKIFWSVTSVVMAIMIGAILKGVMK